jgi:hypothetical protein
MKFAHFIIRQEERLEDVMKKNLIEKLLTVVIAMALLGSVVIPTQAAPEAPNGYRVINPGETITLAEGWIIVGDIEVDGEGIYLGEESFTEDITVLMREAVVFAEWGATAFDPQENVNIPEIGSKALDTGCGREQNGGCDFVKIITVKPTYAAGNEFAWYDPSKLTAPVTVATNTPTTLEFEVPTYWHLEATAGYQLHERCPWNTTGSGPTARDTFEVEFRIPGTARVWAWSETEHKNYYTEIEVVNDPYTLDFTSDTTPIQIGSVVMAKVVQFENLPATTWNWGDGITNSFNAHAYNHGGVFNITASWEFMETQPTCEESIEVRVPSTAIGQITVTGPAGNSLFLPVMMK